MGTKYATKMYIEKSSGRAETFAAIFSQGQAVQLLCRSSHPTSSCFCPACHSWPKLLVVITLKFLNPAIPKVICNKSVSFLSLVGSEVLDVHWICALAKRGVLKSCASYYIDISCITTRFHYLFLRASCPVSQHSTCFIAKCLFSSCLAPWAMR